MGLTQKMIQYNLLRKEAESTEGLYNEILTRVRETNISEKLETSIARVIDPAKVPDKPERPKKLLDIAVSVFLALLCSISAAFLAEYFESAIYTAEDVRNYLNLPFLGYISGIGGRWVKYADKDLVCHKKPDSATAQVYHAARASILFASSEDKPLKSILVTSAIPEEGKTFAAMNIAVVFSQANEKVVLIDAAMRDSRIYKSLEMDSQPGLSDFLTGNAGLEKIVRPTAVKGLSVITFGVIPHNTCGFLLPDKMQTLLKTLKTNFDRVIIDCQPVLGAADSSLLANMADGVILVIRGGRTRLNTILRAKEAILKARGNIIGVLINGIDALKEDRDYHQHYYKK